MNTYRLTITRITPNMHGNEIVVQNFKSKKVAVESAMNFARAIYNRFFDDSKFFPHIPFLSDPKGMKTGCFSIPVENADGVVVSSYEVKVTPLEVRETPASFDEMVGILVC